MKNRISEILVEDRSLDPVAAELRLTVVSEHASRTTEVRGRFLGPSCPYATTVEIAYPLTRLWRPDSADVGMFLVRAAIPEASLWHPQTPFLYAGWVELWQDGEMCDRVMIRHGLRHLALGPRGLRVNGNVLPIHGHAVENISAAGIVEFRERGCNCLAIPLRHENEPVWAEADRLGMLLLGRIASDLSMPLAARMSRRPSCLGWLVGAVDMASIGCLADCCAMIGVDVSGAEVRPIPEGVRFLVGRPAQLTALRASNLPFLIVESTDSAADGPTFRGFQSSPT